MGNGYEGEKKKEKKSRGQFWGNKLEHLVNSCKKYKLSGILTLTQPRGSREETYEVDPLIGVVKGGLEVVTEEIEAERRLG